MAIPASVMGYGSTTNANVFKIKFSQALSSAPYFQGYDNAETFPATGAANATTYKLFTGTAAIPTGMVAIIDTSTEGAPATNWFPEVESSGGCLGSAILVGTKSYMIAESTPGAAGSVKFNMQTKIPHDLTTAATMCFDLVCRYTYTGTTPVINWYFNDKTTGTEEVPLWTEMTSGTHGIRHCRTGAISPTYLADIPDVTVASTQKTLLAYVTA